MTPREILLNVGKLIGFMGIALFVGVSGWAQVAYWRVKDEKAQLQRMPKKSQMLYKFGKWELYFFIGAAILMISTALVRVLWQMVTTGW